MLPLLWCRKWFIVVSQWNGQSVAGPLCLVQDVSGHPSSRILRQPRRGQLVPRRRWAVWRSSWWRSPRRQWVEDDANTNGSQRETTSHAAHLLLGELTTRRTDEGTARRDDRAQSTSHQGLVPEQALQGQEEKSGAQAAPSTTAEQGTYSSQVPSRPYWQTTATTGLISRHWRRRTDVCWVNET